MEIENKLIVNIRNDEVFSVYNEERRFEKSDSHGTDRGKRKSGNQ